MAAAAGAAAGLLVLAMGAHALLAFGQAVEAFGALLNNDARFDPGGGAYSLTFAVGIAIAAATVILMLVWLRGLRRTERGPHDLSGHLGWGLVILGGLLSTAGYVMVATTADDYERVLVTPSNRLGADAVMTGAVLDLVGALVVVGGAIACMLLLRLRTARASL